MSGYSGREKGFTIGDLVYVYAQDRKPPPRFYVEAILPDKSQVMARYSPVNHVWMTHSGRVVWPRWWIEEKREDRR